jgi:hypothetical protein
MAPAMRISTAAHCGQSFLFGRSNQGTLRLSTTYTASVLLLMLLYPACRWYRTVKAAHPQSFLKYF